MKIKLRLYGLYGGKRNLLITSNNQVILKMKL